MNNPPYKTKDGPLTNKDLLNKIDWEAVLKRGGFLKSKLDSLAYQPPEVISHTYCDLVVAIDALAKELLLFDRTDTYRQALEKIIALDGDPGPMLEEVRRIAQEALTSSPPAAREPG